MANTERSRWRWRIILVCIALLLLIAAGAWQLWRISTLPVYGKDLTGVALGGDFSLTDHTGRQVKLSDYRGKVVVLFFGYTYCPDVCPTTLGTLKMAMKELGKDAGFVQVLFVSVDPGHDTPATLAGYIPLFDPRFVGLTGKPDVIANVAQSYNAHYARYDNPSGGYSYDHFAGIYLLDRYGKVRVLTRSELGAQAIAADIRTILALREGPVPRTLWEKITGTGGCMCEGQH